MRPSAMLGPLSTKREREKGIDTWQTLTPPLSSE